MRNTQWKLLVAIALTSTSSLADTDVYLTNNSDKPLTIQVKHTGSDLLQHGSEWFQHIQELKPWETKSVMSFNRWEGVKAGHTYEFETVASNPNGESIRLHQK